MRKLFADPAPFARFEADLARFPLDWFNDCVDVLM
jgi:hypothetical protein